MFGRSLFPSVSLVLAIGFFAVPSLHAQSAVAVDGGVTTLGDGYESISVFETGVRFGSLRRKHVNADVRLATAPQALTLGALVLAADIDAAYVLPLGKGIDATPRAGFSMVAAVSTGGAGAVPGINYWSTPASATTTKRCTGSIGPTRTAPIGCCTPRHGRSSMTCARTRGSPRCSAEWAFRDPSLPKFESL
ncbi:MAG: hypothetical protein DMD54_02360 [Gemmatimonadetes bacterium]|nr:MAG: hypothetical protein DMD54_02360 [Gemmatimonadota bacterium]